MQSVNLISDARYTDDKPNVLHAVKTDQLLVDGVYLKGGQKTGWRKHPDADRAFVCVQGTGELVLVGWGATRWLFARSAAPATTQF